MKCDELKVYEDIDDYIGYDDSPPMMYDKSEVDAAIDELKREHHRERHEYIDMVAQLKAKLVEQESENRRLKRALWLARAESAKNAMCRYYRLAQKEECDPQPHGWSCYINGEVYSTGKMSRKLEPHYWFDVWEEVERKCRAKAEQYK